MCVQQNAELFSNGMQELEFEKDFDKTIRFFRFPNDPEAKRSWMKACGKGQFEVMYARICSLHFTEDDWRLQDRIMNTPMNKRLLDKNAIPSLHLPRGELLHRLSQ